MTASNPLKAYRAGLVPRMTQQALADHLGVTRIAVTRWETGERKIPAERLLHVFKRTGIPPAKLRPDLAPILREP